MKKSHTRGLLSVLSVLMAVALPLSMQASLSLQFANNTSSFGSDDLWIYFDNGGGTTPFNVTYNGGTNVLFGSSGSGTNALSNGIRLSDVTSSEFTVSSISSVAVFVTYGTQFSNLSVSPGFFEDSVSGEIPFQNFEITRTGGSGDQGNLTNINYFTAPFSIQSYSQGALQQSTGFNSSTLQIGNQLNAISSGNAVENGSGELVRYVGPSSWNSNPPYPSFENYLNSVHLSGVSNQIVHANAFNTDGSNGTDGQNYNFQLNLSSAVAADDTITLTGNITTEIKENDGGATSPGPTFSDATLTISGADKNDLNSIIYGQAFESFTNRVTWGQGWTDFEAYVTDPDNNMNLQDVYGTTQRLAIGEITTAILMGFLGNTKEVNGEALNEMDSREWWQLDPMVAFSEIQEENSDFYNEWANIIYTMSANSVYGIPYSDRLGNGPLVNSVQFNGNDIDTWIVGIGEPVTTAIPEPAAFVLWMSAAFFGVVFWRRFQQRH